MLTKRVEVNVKIIWSWEFHIVQIEKGRERCYRQLVLTINLRKPYPKERKSKLVKTTKQIGAEKGLELYKQHYQLTNLTWIYLHKKTLLGFSWSLDYCLLWSIISSEVHTYTSIVLRHFGGIRPQWAKFIWSHYILIYQSTKKLKIYGCIFHSNFQILHHYIHGTENRHILKSCHLKTHISLWFTLSSWASLCTMANTTYFLKFLVLNLKAM